MGRKRSKKRRHSKSHNSPAAKTAKDATDLPPTSPANSPQSGHSAVTDSNSVPESETGEPRKIRQFIYLPIPTKLFFLSVIVVTLFSIAEIIHRIQVNARQAKRQARIAQQDNLYQMTALTNRHRIPLTDKIGNLLILRDQQLIYRQLPDQKSQSFTINSKGFRGQDWTAKKPEDCYRIFILGGSTAFGHSCSDDSKAIAPQLQKFLTKSTGRKIEVLNAGVIGYISDQELNLFRHHLLQYQPDMIILFNGWNDFMGGSTKEKAKPGDYAHSWFFNEIDGLLEKQRTESFNPLDYSSLYRGMKRRIKRYERRAQLQKDLKEGLYQHNPTAIENYKNNLEQMAVLAKHYGIEVLIAPQVEFMQFANRIDPDEADKIKEQIRIFSPGYDKFAGSEYPKYQAAAKQAAINADVHYYDGQFIFAGTKKDVFHDICHYTDNGYAIAAKSLGEQVRRILKRQ